MIISQSMIEPNTINESQTLEKDNILSTLIYLLLGGRSGTPAIYKMELFRTIVSSFQPLTFVTKRSFKMLEGSKIHLCQRQDSWNKTHIW